MQFKIKHQLIIAFITISAVSILISAILIGRSAIHQSEAAIHYQVEQKLIAARDLKKAQIEDYFTLIRNQMVVASSNPWVHEAASGFSSAFFDYPLQTGGEIDHSAIKEYYSAQFDRVYKESNNGQSADVNQLIRGLSDNALFLQQDYIARNQHPLGNKDALIGNGNGSVYDQLHQTYHPGLSKFLETYGFYDVFIVEPESGHVVYSVFKELDFATSLINGPYANSGLAKAFKAAMQLNEADQTVLIDFKPYLPSYEAAASFIASPIMVDGDRSGILIFQMPIDGINAIMTNNGQWRETGFGESGETYLIGQDGLLRSQSRFLLEDFAGYIEAMRNSKDDLTLARIEARKTAIGLQKVDSLGSQQALNGSSGVAYFNDYRDVPVISAYTPLQFAGQNWALLSEIDEAEAFAHQEQLVSSIVATTAMIAFVLIAIMALVGTYFTRVVVKPIDAFSQQLEKITREQDLSIRISTRGNNEFSVLGQSLNKMLDTLADFVRNMRSSAEILANNSNSLNSASGDAAEQINQQNLEVNAAATATTELSASISEVAQSAEQAAEQMRTTRNQVNSTMGSAGLSE